MLSRPVTPAYGIPSARVAVPRDESAQQAARVRTVAGPRPRTAIAGVAVVLVVTFVGLFYLSQTFEAAAARYEVQRLLVEREAMLQELQSQGGSTLALGSESTVTQWARDGNLEPLGPRNRVPAR
jgi:hypothetical protein